MPHIRAIRDEEIARASALTLAAYAALSGIDVGEYRTTLAAVGDRARHAVVLVADDDPAAVSGQRRLLGCVTYVGDPANRYAEFSDGDGAGLRMLAVVPAAQGAGVGTALVLACLERARGDGRRRMVLHTIDAMHGARRLYERLGFRRAPDRDWRPRDGIQLLGYERRIGPIVDRP